MAIKLKPPVWGSISSAVPQRTAGYGPAQQGAAVSPSAPAQAVVGNQDPNGYRGENTAARTSQVPQQQPQPEHQVTQNQQAPNRPQQNFHLDPAPRSQPHSTQVTPRPQQRQQSSQQAQQIPQRGQPNQPGEQMPQQAQQRQPEQTRQNNSPHGTKTPVYVHRKIWTIGGRKKFIDFTDKLSLARVEDYANIHGIGGKDHNWNSVIGITICDYTKGTGAGSSMTLRACLDVEDADQLYEAAKLARMGKLKPDSSLEIKWMDAVLRQLDGWKQYPTAQDGSRAIPRRALNALFSTVSNARASLMPLIGTPFYSYYSEKNQARKRDKKTGLAPCYSLTINYSPYLGSGEKSSYPWYIKIEEFDAPLIEQKNGSIAHKSSEATNKRYAFINLSCDDFWRAMVAVKRYIRTWEHHMTKPLFREAFQRLAAQQEARNDN